MDDSVVNTIIDKVNELLDIENQLKDYAKKLKPLREDKKLIMEELTDLFIKNNLTTYEVNDRVISFIFRTFSRDNAGLCCSFFPSQWIGSKD